MHFPQCLWTKYLYYSLMICDFCFLMALWGSLWGWDFFLTTSVTWNIYSLAYIPLSIAAYEGRFYMQGCAQYIIQAYSSSPPRPTFTPALWWLIPLNLFSLGFLAQDRLTPTSGQWGPFIQVPTSSFGCANKNQNICSSFKEKKSKNWSK